MLDILNTVNEPDLSLPKVVSGIDLNDIGREIYRKKREVEKTTKLLNSSRSPTLATDQSSLSESEFLIKSLSVLDVSSSIFLTMLKNLQKSGYTVAETKAYWEQKPPRLPVNKGDELVQIHACAVPPPVDLTQQGIAILTITYLSDDCTH